MEFEFIRKGPDGGWRMSADLFAKCPECGYFMSLDPEKDEVCPCGNLRKDNGAGRFGAKTGDDSIEIYRKVGD